MNTFSEYTQLAERTMMDSCRCAEYLDTDDPTCGSFYASDEGCKAYGATEDEASSRLARYLRIPLWNEEEYINGKEAE